MWKKFIALVFVMCFVVGTVHASSINGDFEGNPIVKIKSNGVDIQVEDTPAVIYNGRTMVPVYMLKQLGMNVSWEQETYSVDVSLNENNGNSDYLNKIDGIKVNVLQVDNFTITENTAEYLREFDGTLSLYFSGASNNYSSRFTSVEIEEQFNQMQETVNKNNKIITDFIAQYSYLDNAKLREQMDLILTSLENTKQSKNSLLQWDNLRYADPKKSELHFDSYLEYRSKAVADYQKVIRESHVEYLKVVDQILKM